MSDLARQVRERLGLNPDATDEQVTAALDARLGQQGEPSGTQPPQNGQTGQAGDGGAAGPTTVPAQPADANQQGQTGDQAGQGGQQAPPADGQGQTGDQSGQGGQVSASALERLIADRVAAATAPLAASLAETSRELADRKERERRERRDALLASAVHAGKITPASLEGDHGWRAQYDASPAGAAAVELVMASLADNSAIATGPRGTVGPPEPSSDGFSDADYDRLWTGVKS